MAPIGGVGHAPDSCGALHVVLSLPRPQSCGGDARWLIRCPSVDRLLLQSDRQNDARNHLRHARRGDGTGRPWRTDVRIRWHSRRPPVGPCDGHPVDGADCWSVPHLAANGSCPRSARRLGKAALIGAWGALVVGTIDNFLYPAWARRCACTRCRSSSRLSAVWRCSVRRASSSVRSCSPRRSRCSTFSGSGRHEEARQSLRNTPD